MRLGSRSNRLGSRVVVYVILFVMSRRLPSLSGALNGFKGLGRVDELDVLTILLTCSFLSFRLRGRKEESLFVSFL